MRVFFEVIPNDGIDLLAERFATDAVDNFSRKRMDQHAASCFQTDAAGAEVENGFVVQLPDGRTVGAFHIIGVNLKLRLGVGGGVVRKEQILVGLLGVRLLSFLTNENASMEHAFGAAIQ